MKRLLVVVIALGVIAGISTSVALHQLSGLGFSFAAQHDHYTAANPLGWSVQYVASSALDTYLSTGFISGATFLLSEQSAAPKRLLIPTIHVDAAIERVGVKADGSMDVPKLPADVAWFSLGIRPGEVGSAVIAGHYGRQNGRGSVFDDLHKVRTGDKIYIDDDAGGRASFMVADIRRFDANRGASSVFASSDGIARLNLVTCEGVWDEHAQQYTQRLVVFAVKE